MSEFIGGKEALIAYANGEHVQYQGYDKKWRDDIKTVCLLEFSNGSYVFRIKPKTITINGIEVPAPFEPKEGDTCYFLNDEGMKGYSYVSSLQKDNWDFTYGAWRTEEEIKQVVAALRTIFKGES